MCLAALGGLVQGAVRIEYLGHASFLIEDSAGGRVVTDPFLDGYPLAFPQRLSVDVVAISERGAAHDSAFQLRGWPAVLGPKNSSATAGAMKVEALPLGDKRAYVIESGAQKIVFLGEAAGGFTPEIEQAIRAADALLVSPAARGAIEPLRKRGAAIALMRPDKLQPAGDWKAEREMDALEVGATAAIVTLKPRPLPAEPPDRGIFRHTMVELSWPQMRRAVEEDAIVLLPVGVIETHGPHMGLGADTTLGHQFAVRLKAALAERGVKALIAPPLYWGLMTDTAPFPGSFHMRPETFSALLQDVAANLKKWGFRRVFYINTHGDPQQRKLFGEAVAAARRDLGLETYDVFRIDAPIPEPPRSERTGAFRPDYHAGANETRVAADSNPDDVDFRLASRLKPQPNFQPHSYVGDPASWAKEDGASESWKAAGRTYAERVIYALEHPATTAKE